MSTDPLDALKKSQKYKSTSSRRSLSSIAVALVLIAAFVAVILLVFGDRLRPRIPVATAGAVMVESDGPESGSSLVKTETLDQMTAQASGWIEADPYSVHVPVFVDGFVETVHVLEGQTITNGQLLATLDATNLTLSAEQREAEWLTAKAYANSAQSSVEMVQSELARTTDRHNRIQPLSENDIPEVERESVRLELARKQAELNKAESDLEMANARAQEAKIKLKQAEIDLSRTQIFSPQNAVVENLYVAPGMKRMAGMDDPKSSAIVSLYDPGKLQVRVDVPLSDFGRVKTGMTAKIYSAAFPGQTFTGSVSRMTGEADITRNTVQVKVSIHHPDERMRPEMLCRVEFFSSSEGLPSTASGASYSIWIPETAILNEDGKNAEVWVVHPTDQTVSLRTVEIGNRVQGGYRNVISGIRPGERVVVNGFEKLSDGALVKEVQEEST